MKTVRFLVICVLGVQLAACMRTAETARREAMPGRPADTAASPSSLILGVN